MSQLPPGFVLDPVPGQAPARGPVYGPPPKPPEPPTPLQINADTRAAQADARAAAAADREAKTWQATHDPVTGKPLPNANPGREVQAERAAQGFYQKARDANYMYESQHVGARSYIGQKMYDNASDVLNNLPGWIGNSSERQQADAYQEAFVNAILRNESGAAVPDAELKRYQRIYFPVTGDGPEAIQAKAALRQNGIDALRAAAGTAFHEMPDPGVGMGGAAAAMAGGHPQTPPHPTPTLQAPHGQQHPADIQSIMQKYGIR